MKYPHVVRPKKITSHTAVSSSKRRGIGRFQRYSANIVDAASASVITGNRPSSNNRPEDRVVNMFFAPQESNFQTSSQRHRFASPLASSIGTTNHASRLIAGIRTDAARTTRRDRSPRG